MNLLEMRTELAARGFDYLSSVRQDYFLNRAYLEMCESADFPFLKATATGTSPLEIEDLRTIDSVSDDTQDLKLYPLAERHVSDLSTDLDLVGTPFAYRMVNATTLAAYPTNASTTFTVSYYKVPESLSTDSDEPLIPSSYHQVIVDGATMYAYFDSDNFEAAGQWSGLWEQGKERLKQALYKQSRGQEDYILAAEHKNW